MNPIALAYPRTDERIEQGRYSSMMPVTPANGFTLICRTKPGSGDAIRAYRARLGQAIVDKSDALAVLRLHYLRWILFDDDTRSIHMGIFDTDFDKYFEDVLTLFKRVESAGVTPLFEYMEGFPEDWKDNPAAFAKWAREVHARSFAEYPDVTAVEVVKALKVEQALCDMLEQMQ